MNYRSLVTFTAFATGLAISASAMAQGVEKVWDSKGKQVGVWIGNDEAARTFPDNVDRIFFVFKNGVEDDAQFFYESANCTGQRYGFGGDSATYQQIVHTALFENAPSPGSKGQTFWAPVEGQLVSQFKFGSTWEGECYAGDNQLYWMTPLTAVDTTSKGFSPPFCVASTFAECAAQFLHH